MQKSFAKKKIGQSGRGEANRRIPGAAVFALIVIMAVGCGNDAPPPANPPAVNSAESMPPAPKSNFAETNSTVRDATSESQTRALTESELKALTTGAPPVSTLRMQLESTNDLPELDPTAMDLPALPIPEITALKDPSLPDDRAFDSIDLDGPELSIDFDRMQFYRVNTVKTAAPPPAAPAPRPSRPSRTWSGYN